MKDARGNTQEGFSFHTTLATRHYGALSRDLFYPFSYFAEKMNVETREL